MKRAVLLGLLLIVAALVTSLGAASAATATESTATGIPLDASWKVRVYHLARTAFVHPAWGWQHGERNYRIAQELAHGDGLTVDDDVLFAAAMLHDMAAFKPYVRRGEHGDVAARESEAILRESGFPMKKFAVVQAAMRGHMYYSSAGTHPEAIVLHDADSLDFLGAIGAVRMLALTGASSASASEAVRSLREVLRDVPPRLITKTAKSMAATRTRELRAILDAYDRESFGTRLP